MTQFDGLKDQKQENKNYKKNTGCVVIDCTRRP